MTAPKPATFDQMVDKTIDVIANRLATLKAEYATAHDASHRKIVRETVGRSPGTSDPTGSIVTGPIREDSAGQIADYPGAQASVRHELEGIPKRLAQLENEVTGITRRLELAMDRLDPREGFVALRYPISVSNEDLAASRAAQARRRARGEGAA